MSLLNDDDVVCQAARRSLEQQRQMEWERQRRDQLMSEKLREQSTVDKLSVEVGQLRQELQVLVRHASFVVPVCLCCCCCCGCGVVVIRVVVVITSPSVSAKMGSPAGQAVPKWVQELVRQCLCGFMSQSGSACVGG